MFLKSEKEKSWLLLYKYKYAMCIILGVLYLRHINLQYYYITF